MVFRQWESAAASTKERPAPPDPPENPKTTCPVVVCPAALRRIAGAGADAAASSHPDTAFREAWRAVREVLAGRLTRGGNGRGWRFLSAGPRILSAVVEAGPAGRPSGDDRKTRGTRYEALAVALVRTDTPAILRDWPSSDSPLRFEHAFERLFREYDQRYVFAAPRLSATTGRIVWRADSPAFSEPMARDYPVRCNG